MSTVHKPRHSTATPKADRFFYGWRDVWQKGGNGRRRLVQVPLTEEDVQHPREGDHIVNNDLHAVDCAYLCAVFKSILASIAGVLVFSDVGIYWDDRSLRHHSPDVAVIFGARRRRQWRSFDVAEEGVRPRLLIEVTSLSTRHTDLVTKRRKYYRAGVEYYVIVDELPERRVDDPRQLRILGYRRGRRGYERLDLNEQGRLWLEPVGVWLGIDDGHVVCYDRDHQRLGEYAEVAQALAIETRARAAAEEREEIAARARAAAEERIRQLEEELRRRNGR